MLSKHGLAVRVDFNKSNCSESCPSRRKAEAADAAEEVEVRKVMQISSPGREGGIGESSSPSWQGIDQDANNVYTFIVLGVFVAPVSHDRLYPV